MKVCSRDERCRRRRVEWIDCLIEPTPQANPQTPSLCVKLNLGPPVSLFWMPVLWPVLRWSWLVTRPPLLGAP
jgi:hypothetical protein